MLHLHSKHTRKSRVVIIISYDDHHSVGHERSHFTFTTTVTTIIITSFVGMCVWLPFWNKKWYKEKEVKIQTAMQSFFKVVCLLLFFWESKLCLLSLLLLVLFTLHFIIPAIRTVVTSIPLYMFMKVCLALHAYLCTYVLFSACPSLQQSKRDTTTFSRKIRRKDGRIDYYYAKTFAWLFEQKK